MADEPKLESLLSPQVLALAHSIVRVQQNTWDNVYDEAFREALIAGGNRRPCLSPNLVRKAKKVVELVDGSLLMGDQSVLDLILEAVSLESRKDARRVAVLACVEQALLWDKQAHGTKRDGVPVVSRSAVEFLFAQLPRIEPTFGKLTKGEVGVIFSRRRKGSKAAHVSALLASRCRAFGDRDLDDSRKAFSAAAKRSGEKSHARRGG